MRWRDLAVALAVLIPAGTVFGTDTSVPFIHADLVHWQGVFGLGVTVAVVDEGVDYYEFDLAGDIAPGGISFPNGLPTQDGGADPNGAGGHGTLMSLIITGTTGVAPAARILPIRTGGGIT